MPTEQCKTSAELLAIYRHTAVDQGFLTDSLVTGMVQSEKDKIEFDFERTQYGMAPFVRACDEGMATMSDGFYTKWFRPAYIKMKDALNVCDTCPMWYVGERPYSSLSLSQKRDLAIANILTRHRRMLRNRREWTAAQLARTGAYNVVFQGSSGETIKTVNLDFGRAAALDVSPTTDWDQATATPAKDLETWINVLAETGECVPNMVIAGSDAMTNMVSHEDFNDLMNAGARLRSSRFDITTPSVKARDSVRYVGSFANIEYYTYTGRYHDANGASQYYVKPNEVLIVGRPIEYATPVMTQMYGAIKDFDALRPVDAFIKQWRENDPSAIQTLTQQAPLMFMLQPNLVMRATVLP